MPNLAIVPTAEPEPPPDRLAELRAEAAALAAEFASLAEQKAALQRFEADEAAILAEIGELGAREVAAVREWAARPTGAPPAPLAKEREKLAHRLAAAQASAGAAGLAVSELETRQREVHAKQLAIEPEITGEVFDRIEAEFAAKAAELSRSIAETRVLAADLAGLKMALADQGRHLSDAGKIDEARPLFARNERLAVPSILETQPEKHEIHAAAHRWIAHAEALRTGAAQ